MPSAPRLEAFEMAAPAGTAPEGRFLDAHALESERLGAYEAGFTAGWEEAGARSDAAAADHAARIAAALESLDFTYAEAGRHCLAALGPLFEAMLGTLLPALARESVMPETVELLLAVAVKSLENPLELHVPLGEAAAYEAALQGRRPERLRICENEALGAGEARILTGQGELRVDFAAVISRIHDALIALYSLETKESRHA